jgi:hypothetical protein
MNYFYLLTIFFFIYGSAHGNILPSDFFSDSDGISISTANRYACAVQEQAGVEIGGRIVCWGDDMGEVGVLEAPKTKIFVQVSCSDQFACGVTIDQTVECWGDMKESVPGLYSQITASKDFACGVMVDGKLNCWGTLFEFQAFDFDSIILFCVTGKVRYIPKLPEDASQKYVQVSCASAHCCALNVKGQFLICCAIFSVLNQSHLPSSNLYIGHAICWGHNLHHQAEPPKIEVSHSGEEVTRSADEDEDEYGDEEGLSPAILALISAICNYHELLAHF